MTFSELIKSKFRYGGWSFKIIFFNVVIFLIINLFYQFDNGVPLWKKNTFTEIIDFLFVLPNTYPEIFQRPWTWFTHMFAHQGFLHLAFNMLWLYFGAQLFTQFLGNKRLIYVYILGGLMAALAQMLAEFFIPMYSYRPVYFVGMIGASGAVYAVFIATAYFKPLYEVMLFGLFKVRLVYIALFLVISDFLRLTDFSSVAHIAHLGGAAFGVMSIIGLGTFDRFIKWFESFGGFFKGGFPAMRSRMFMRTVKEPKVKHYHKADEQYFETKQEIQFKVDAILDKIKRKGYDGLTKAEKEYLFNQKDKL